MKIIKWIAYAGLVGYLGLYDSSGLAVSHQKPVNAYSPVAIEYTDGDINDNFKFDQIETYDCLMKIGDAQLRCLEDAKIERNRANIFNTLEICVLVLCVLLLVGVLWILLMYLNREATS